MSFGRGELLIQALIVLNLGAFAIGTLPNLSDHWQRVLWVFEVFSVVVFTVEYGCRIFFCRPRGDYAFSFFGIVDLLAVLPFYLSLGLDLRSVRILRMLRLFRVLKLARYSEAIRRYRRAFVIVKEELILFGFSALILLYLSGVGIYYFEKDVQPDEFGSVFHSLWWSMVTLTTVGYGDVYPITVGGRIFTFAILVIGLGVVAIPSGLFASALSKARDGDSES